MQLAYHWRHLGVGRRGAALVARSGVSFCSLDNILHENGQVPRADARRIDHVPFCSCLDGCRFATTHMVAYARSEQALGTLAA